MKRANDKVLILDDEPGNQDVLQRKTIEEGFQVLVASSRFQAFSMLLEKSFGIVLINASKFEPDLGDFCERIRSDETMHHIALIALIDEKNMDKVGIYYSMGFDDFMVTPLNRKELIQRLKIQQLLKDRKASGRSEISKLRSEVERLSLRAEELKMEARDFKNKNIQLLESGKKFIELERVKNNFLRTICHELRTPVSAILGFVEILYEYENGNDEENILETITSASDKLKNLTDTALMITQIDPEKIAENMRPTNINSMVEYAVSDTLPFIQKKNIKIVQPEKKDFSEVVIEPGLIKEVISIFLNNSVYYSRSGGEIRIIVRETSEQIELTLEDEGKGFSHDEMLKLRKFLDTDKMPKQSEWPGLRFAVAKFITDIHHVQIRIANNDRGGATVKLIFPVNPVKRDQLHQQLSRLN